MYPHKTKRVKYLFLTIMLFIAIICNISYSTNYTPESENGNLNEDQVFQPDYMMDVNLELLDSIYKNLLRYKKKEKLSQKVIDMDDSCTFDDYTTIRRVQVKEDDEFRKNKIAITIDDSFFDEYTEAILDVLDKHNCKATFYITHTLLKKNPDRVIEIAKRGHELGNHTMTHSPFKGLHAQRKLWEIITLNLWVKTITDIDMSTIRFPTGSYDDEAIVFSKVLNMYPIGWSINSNDYEFNDLEKAYEHTISQKAGSGDIVLLHNGYDFSAELIDRLLTYWEAQGLSFTTVTDLVYTRDFTVKFGFQRETGKW